jgi:hypothetical protein
VTDDDRQLERVRYQGGQLDGAILEMSPLLAHRVHSLDLVITPGGKVADWSRGGWVLMPTIKIVEPPHARRTTTSQG